MNNNNYGFWILSIGIVLSGIATGFGVASGMAIMSYARNPSLVEQIFDFLRTGLLVTMIPFAILILILNSYLQTKRVSISYRRISPC